MWNFVTGLRVVDGIERPLKVSSDSRAATEFSNNNGSSSASKHIDIYLVVIERVQNHILPTEHIGTNFMLADPLTKALTPKVFHRHTAQMGVVSLEDIQF